MRIYGKYLAIERDIYHCLPLYNYMQVYALHYFGYPANLPKIVKNALIWNTVYVGNLKIQQVLAVEKWDGQQSWTLIYFITKSLVIFYYRSYCWSIIILFIKMLSDINWP